MRWKTEKLNSNLIAQYAAVARGRIESHRRRQSLPVCFGRFVHSENKRECKLGATRIRWRDSEQNEIVMLFDMK